MSVWFVCSLTEIEHARETPACRFISSRGIRHCRMSPCRLPQSRRWYTVPQATYQRSSGHFRGGVRPSGPLDLSCCSQLGENQGFGCLNSDLGLGQHSCRRGIRNALSTQTSVVARCPVVTHIQQIETCGQSFQDRHASSTFWGPTVRRGTSVGSPCGCSRRAASLSRTKRRTRHH